MIGEKKLIEELREKGKEYDKDCGYWERKGEEGNRLICAGKCVGIEQAIEIVKNQPKIGEWIPCSERLPEDGETYLITNKESFCQNNTYKGWYDGNIWHMNGNLERKMNVIAWMPLPEPYREGQEIKKQTNADMIRNMTDEELSSFLCKTVYENGENLFSCDDYAGTSVCDGCQCGNCKAYLHWLQSEVEE